MIQYAKNLIAVGQALGMNIKSKGGGAKKAAQLAELNEWITWDDFPKKKKSGWEVEELVKWFDSNASRIGDARLQKRARHKVINDSFDLKPTDLKILDKRQSAKIVSQSHMNEVLSNKYNATIGKKNLSDWSNGRRLPEGAPEFPHPDSGTGWSAAAFEKCCAWYEQFIKNPKQGNNNQPGLFADLGTLARQAEQQQIIDQGKIKAKELELIQKSDDKNFLPVTEVMALADDIGALLNRKINDLDKTVAKAFGAREGVLQLPDDVRAVVIAELTTVVFEAAAAVKEALANALTKGEKV